MSSFKLSAIKILRDAKEPLHYEEITKRAIEKNLIETQGATPEATMSAIIGRDIKFNKEKSPFIREKKGFITLNPKFSQQEQKLEEKKEKEIEKESDYSSSTQYVGSVGEHRVLSELLFRGYNASIMSVDEGLDIVSTKDNKLFNIQVKTSNENKFNKYVYDIRKMSFERFDTGNTFYIFVLLAEKTNFLILPSSEIEKNVQQKNILIVDHGNRYRVNLAIRENKVYLGKLTNDATFFLNNWGLLK